MKLILSGIILLTLVATTPGCAPTVKVTSDFDRAADFSQFKTFRLSDNKNGNMTELNATRVFNAIRDNLEKKGFTEGGEDADLLVNAVSIMQSKISVTANSYSYGGVYRPYGYWGVGAGSSTTTFDTHTYVDGSLIIDIVNRKEKKLLWQGIGNAEIDKTIENPDRFIRDAVTDIMHGFPPGGKKKNKSK
jgi:hypothetical protein